MRSPRLPVLCTTIAFLVAAIALPLAANAHHGADAVITGSQSAPLAATVETTTGTVDELVVDNRVTGTTTRYTLLRGDNGNVVGLRGANAESLFKGTRIAASGRRAGDMLQVESYGVISAAAPRAAIQSTGSGQVQGTLLLAHADDFENNRGEFKLVVRADDGNSTELRIGIMPDALRAGMTVVAYGAPNADNISLDTQRVEVLALAPASKASAQGFSIQSLTTNNVLVMLVKFTDSPAADAFTPVQVQQVMVSNPGSVANYYSEVSFGQQALNITVACLTPSAGCTANTYAGGWLKGLDPTTKLPVATPANCSYSTIRQYADAAATKAGYNVASYSNRYYVFPYESACGWAGLAYVGYGEAYSNGYNQLGVYGHELGHNFGLLHAGRLTCTGLSVCASGSVSEYGDSFDVMGNISTMHFNAMQKSLLQWIPAASVKTHTSGTATYTISPIESGGAASYAIKIPAAANRTYWVEYRQPIGFDGPALGGLAFPSNGAQVRLSSPFTSISGSDDTQLLDMTPGTSSFTDAALLAGQSYTDSTYGVTVTVGTASPSSLSVTVAMGAGAPTTTTLASSINPSGLGAMVTFTATVTGSAPTGTVNFTDSGSSLAGCGAVTLSGSGNVRTAQCSASALSGGTHSIAAAYGGDAANNASGSAAVSQVVNKATSTSGVVSSKNPSTFGASVTFTATVTGTAPTGSVNFKDGAASITGCSAVALAGSGNSRTAACTTSALTAATHSITAAYAGDAANAASTSAALSQVVNAGGGSINVALASNGSVATASSTYSSSFPVSAIINNIRTGANWGVSGGWNDNTQNAWPDWVQINFNGSKTIDHVVVYTVQDNYANPIEPTDTTTFTLYGITAFTVQGWNGNSWVTLGSVSGNNLVKRTVNFSAYTTNRIRINVTAALSGFSRITEVEAWGH